MVIQCQKIEFQITWPRIFNILKRSKPSRFDSRSRLTKNRNQPRTQLGATGEPLTQHTNKPDGKGESNLEPPEPRTSWCLFFSNHSRLYLSNWGKGNQVRRVKRCCHKYVAREEYNNKKLTSASEIRTRHWGVRRRGYYRLLARAVDNNWCIRKTIMFKKDGDRFPSAEDWFWTEVGI